MYVLRTVLVQRFHYEIGYLKSVSAKKKPPPLLEFLNVLSNTLLCTYVVKILTLMLRGDTCTEEYHAVYFILIF